MPSVSTYNPPLPIAGSGTIDEVAGAYDVTLSDFSIQINVIITPGDPPDADINISNWGQVGTFTGAGDMTSTAATGTVGCTDLGGGIGSFICALIDPTVAAWPATGASGPFGAPGAVIDVAANTIVITEAFDPNGGQVQNTYSYTPAAVPVPTLSDWGMMALGLLVMTLGIVAILRLQKLHSA
ncbi:MAG: hypothetical protein VX252_11775 [Myxococcota bacterium]|nr:hypothetical protein [Myxococcota bacterium]